MDTKKLGVLLKKRDETETGDIARDAFVRLRDSRDVSTIKMITSIIRNTKEEVSGVEINLTNIITLM